MQLFTRAILIALFLPFAVVAEDNGETDENLLDDIEELLPEEFERYLRKLEEQGFAKLPTGPEPGQEEREFSGKWIQQDGVRYCDGYLTRNADEEYCSANVPEDWRPFEFDGVTYFVAPLRNDHE